MVEALAAKGATVYSLDLLPRISRAQSMDALSSQATVSGYRAGLSAAEHLAKFFPMFMTAAGTVPPAKVLVMGAGVAGLQAIATARRLGAVVRAYDVRAAAKEEVQSLGAKFVELDLETQDGAGGYAKEQSAEYLAKQQELLAAEVAASDVVITTAQIPGRKAPVLVTEAMVRGMSEGAVIVDMAADSGGNCELSVAGEDVVVDGVTVVGLTNPPASMPTHASFLFARNIANFLGLVVTEGELVPDFDDEIVVGTCVVRAGQVVHGPTAEALGLSVPARRHPSPAPSGRRPSSPMTPTPAGVMSSFLSGDIIIRDGDPRVPHDLRAGDLRRQRSGVPGAEHPAHAAHVGQQCHPRHRAGRRHDHHGHGPGAAQMVLGFFAVLLATLNIVGGFTVTDRMLEMFKSKPSDKAAGAKAADDRGRCQVSSLTSSRELAHTPVWIDLSTWPPPSRSSSPSRD